MPLEPITDFVPLENAGSAAHLFTPIQSIGILVYTDDIDEVKDDEDTKFGVGLLRKFLNLHQPTFGKADIKLEHRKADTDSTAKRRLTHPDLLPSGKYDQVWFFGIHLSNLSEPRSGPNFSKETRGGPESELTPKEISALEEWMKTGGVLVTGDHSEGKFSPSPELNPLLSLGRALGQKVPRAGQLRTWDGGPTTSRAKSVNTQEPNNRLPLMDDTPHLEDGRLQSDDKPQRIILLRYDALGNLDEKGDFHNLFKDRRGREIDVFPDHMHEGELPALKDVKFDAKWPTGGPLPRVVAVGVDKRNAKTHNMVVVYNGHNGAVPAGRIVADSTWHHYFNENLRGFAPKPGENLVEDSVADLIGQYYGNLAVWLSPPEKRRKMSEAMYWWLFNHQPVRDESSDDPLVIGRVARQALVRVAPACEINELLQAHTSESFRLRFPTLNFPASGSAVNSVPSQELILGSVIKEFRRSVAQAAAPPVAAATTAVSEGLAMAFSIHVETLKQMGEEAQALSESFV